METKKELSNDNFEEEIQKMIKSKKHEYAKKAIVGFLVATTAAAALGATKDLKNAVGFAGLTGMVALGVIGNNIPDKKEEMTRNEAIRALEEKAKRKEKVKKIFVNAKNQVLNR